MARKSRVSIDLQEQKTTLIKERIPTAIYARLSVVNSGKSEDKDVIQNQIEICKNYVEENPEFDLVETYIENGRTGTTFDRPQFNRLIEDIKTGKIKCLIVRDLSRFGRDYIETGTYLERIFPNIGFRFISIKEQYDSFTTDKTNEALMIPLQNMINSLYSKDISRKVSSALKAQMKAGTFKTRNLPYGYMWGEDKKVLVDEEVAHYVKMIFQWKIAGVSSYEICRKLNELEAPTAEYRKYENGVKKGNKQKSAKWLHSTIYNICQNSFYTGDTTLGKNESAIYKGVKNQLVKDKEKWIVFPDTHEALVSHADFEQVQNIMQEVAKITKQKNEDSKKARAKMIDLFEGKIFCADCGKRMWYIRKKLDYKSKAIDKWCGFYNCSSNSRRLTPNCPKRYIQQKHLEEKVLTAIKTQVKVALDYEKLLLKLKDSIAEKSIRDRQNALVASLNLKLNGLQKKRTKLYEDFVNGILNEAEYLFAKSNYDENFQNINTQLENAIENRIKFNDAMSSNNKWILLMKSISKAQKITSELVEQTVQRILVYEDGSIALEMKYSDIYNLTVGCVKEVENEVIA